MDLFGIKLIGFTSDSLTKLLMTIGVVAAVMAVRWLVAAAARLVRGGSHADRIAFWVRQGANLTALVLIVVSLMSIWFDDARQMQTVIGFATAGVAIASQRAVTAFAGYLVIMRGKTFTVGDRIKMGGVQGDVISLGFLQTRILEMGQPPDVTNQEPPGMWVRSRQFSGRIVSVTNDKIFDEPVYNFTHEFPFIWEEIRLGIGYTADHALVERVLIDAATDAMKPYEQAAEAARGAVQRRYGVALDEKQPRVYWRITDNWLELALRFVVPEHGVREIKDQMSRQILAALNQAGISIASTTFEIVGLPPLRIERVRTAMKRS